MPKNTKNVAPNKKQFFLIPSPQQRYINSYMFCYKKTKYYEMKFELVTAQLRVLWKTKASDLRLGRINSRYKRFERQLMNRTTKYMLLCSKWKQRKNDKVFSYLSAFKDVVLIPFHE